MIPSLPGEKGVWGEQGMEGRLQVVQVQTWWEVGVVLYLGVSQWDT